MWGLKAIPPIENMYTRVYIGIYINFASISTMLMPKADEECLASEGQVVDHRCVGDGGWYTLEEGWSAKLCDDDTCKIRCKADGSAFNADKGESWGIGRKQSCWQAIL